MDVLFLVGKGRRWIRTQLNPTGRWPVGKTSSQTGFILIALLCKANHRIHLTPVPDTASLPQKLNTPSEDIAIGGVFFVGEGRKRKRSGGIHYVG